jgi:hypothetical protein
MMIASLYVLMTVGSVLQQSKSVLAVLQRILKIRYLYGFVWMNCAGHRQEE